MNMFDTFLNWKNGEMTDKEFENFLIGQGKRILWIRYQNCKIGTSDLGLELMKLDKQARPTKCPECGVIDPWRKHSGFSGFFWACRMCGHELAE